MASETIQFARPPSYPKGGTYADLLYWHLFVWGTRPGGSVTERGADRWTEREFRTKIFGANDAQESEAKIYKSWIGDGKSPHPPGPDYWPPIARALFNDEPQFEVWANDLDLARKRSRGKGNNVKAIMLEGALAELARAGLTTPSTGSLGSDDTNTTVTQTHFADPTQENAALVAGRLTQFFVGCDDEATYPVGVLQEWPRLSPIAAQLADCMSDISEKCWYAGWQHGLEYDLWGFVTCGPRECGQGHVTAQQIELLKILSEACGGWVVASEHSPPGAHPHQWVPIEYWKAHINEPERCPIEGKIFHDRSSDGQRRLVYGFVDDASRSSWKREALFFDRIVLPDFTASLDADEWFWDGHKFWDDGKATGEETRLVLDLVRKGVVVPSAVRSFSQGPVEESIAAEMRKHEPDSVEFETLGARLHSLRFSRIHGVEAYPVYQSLRSFSASLRPQREAVLRIVFGRMPMPGPNVSWDEIIGYRQDPESQRRFAALRVWVNRAVSGRVPTHEVVDELEHLTAEFEAHMRRHRVQFELTPFESVIAESPEAIAEMSALYGQSDGKAGVTMLKASGAMFPEWELAAPGKELAYISIAKGLFSTN